MRNLIAWSLMAVFTIGVTSCKSTLTTNFKPEASLTLDTLSFTGGDYTLTDPFQAEVEISYFLGLNFKNWVMDYSYAGNSGPVMNMSNVSGLDKGLDLARYQLAIENPEVDMLTEYELVSRKDFKTKFLYITWFKESKITVRARGLIYRLD